MGRFLGALGIGDAGAAEVDPAAAAAAADAAVRATTSPATGSSARAGRRASVQGPDAGGGGKRFGLIRALTNKRDAMEDESSKPRCVQWGCIVWVGCARFLLCWLSVQVNEPGKDALSGQGCGVLQGWRV